jgi:hypothetical protein
MVVIDKSRFLWKDRLAFFPNLEEIIFLNGSLSFNTILRVRQTSVELCDYNKLISHEARATNCIDLTKDLGWIYADMHPKSCRYKINRAQRLKDRIQVQLNNNDVYKDFVKVYNMLARQKGHTYPISQRYLYQYLSLSDVWVIYYDERPICGHLIVLDSILQRAHLCYSASLHLNSKEDAKLSGDLNRYLHWHEIQAYKNRSFKLYDFGGGGGASLQNFKSSFGGFVVPEYNYVFSGKLSTSMYKVYKQFMRVRLRLRT